METLMTYMGAFGLATGAGAIVFDVKTGDGAFMRDRRDATRLAELLEVDAGQDPDSRDLGRVLFSGPRRVVILDMAQHLFLTSVSGYDAFAAVVGSALNRGANVSIRSGYAPEDLGIEQ